jgi:hypothetical protein
MRKFRNLLASFGLAVAVMTGSPAMAGPTSASGIIRSTTLSGGSNYAFRIYLSQAGADPLSQCQNGFAYLNTADDNYQVKVAGLMSAYSTNKTVSLTSIFTDPNGFCRIMDISY